MDDDVPEEEDEVVSSAPSSPLRAPIKPDELAYNYDPAYEEAFQRVEARYEEKRARQKKLPTLDEYKPSTRHGKKLKPLNLRESERKTVLRAAKFVVGVSSSIGGEPLRRCSGFWVDWDEEKKTGIVLTMAYLVFKDHPSSCLKKVFAHDAEVIVHLRDDTAAEAHLLYYHKHYNIALFRVTADQPIQLPSFNNQLHCDQEIFELGRDKHSYLRIGRGRVKHSDDSFFFDGYHCMGVLGGHEDFEYKDGGPVVDFDGNVIGMVLSWESYIPSSILLKCLHLWKKYRLGSVDLPAGEPISWNTNHVVAWRDHDLPAPVYVRINLSGAFYTYPALGGPFRTVAEVQTAVDLHARGTATAHPERKSVLDKLSHKERLIRESLYYPDGTKKVSTEWQIADLESDNVRRLVEALLDKHNVVQDRSYELVDIVHWQSICEGAHEWYYHVNITLKEKGGADSDTGSGDLFFAEVTLDQQETPGYFLSCFCRVKPDGDDNKLDCHGCAINGSVHLKHAQDDLYTGGHMKVGFPPGFGPCNEMQWRDSHSHPAEEADLIKEEEDRIRHSFDYLDDEEFLKGLFKIRRKKKRALRIEE